MILSVRVSAQKSLCIEIRLHSALCGGGIGIKILLSYCTKHNILWCFIGVYKLKRRNVVSVCLKKCKTQSIRRRIRKLLSEHRVFSYKLKRG